MNGARGPALKDLVLIGGGHSHVIVLRRLGMRPVPGLRVTVIARDVHTPYSGMLPGLIAGHYGFDDVHVDLDPLSGFANARLYHDEAVGLDLPNRTVRCRNRPPVPYDVLSIDVGATPAINAAGAGDHAVPLKPIATLVERWERLKARVREAPRALRIGVVGAGAAGVEIVLAAQHALGRLLAEDGRAAEEPAFHLFSAADRILPAHNRGARARFARVLRARGVEVHVGARVEAVRPGAVVVEGGTACELDEVIWAAEAGAPSWPAEAGLDVDERGFIRVAATLESTSHAGVFAAGDVAAVVDHPREKAGVFAVRQGPPLDANLRRAVRGEPLEPFRPQRRFLSLISAGDRYAVASRGRWSLEGRWVWAWKDRIDRRFMARFSNLPEMASGGDAAPDERSLVRLAPPETVRQFTNAAMRCAGCGSKVGATLLDRVLSRLSPYRSSDVVAGLEAFDDASVERVPPGLVAVRTVDAFRAIVDDPYLFGRIAANHCLGDVYAMGAEPRTALAIVTIPPAPDAKMEALLHDLLAGVVETLNAAETTLVGGHTAEGAEITLGLSLSGVADPARVLRKSGMRPGDRLVLTAPIGTGTLFAARMRRKAKGRWIDAAVRSMLRSSRAAAACLREHGAAACTDVTGFGLLGHLLEMARASDVDARLTLPAAPILAGARETVAQGLLSSLHPHNERLGRAVVNAGEAAAAPIYPIVFDPQTAGGLLASVPPDRAAPCLRALRSLGYDHAAVVGAVEPRGTRPERIRIDLQGGDG